MKSKLSPDRKREFLSILMTTGKAAANAYLEKLDCLPAIIIYKSEAELKAIKQKLERCCPDESDGAWVFLPDNGRD